MKQQLMSGVLLVGLLGCSYQQPVPVTIEHVSPAVRKAIVADARHQTDTQAESYNSLPTKAALGEDPVSEVVEQLTQQLTNGLNYNRVRRLPIVVLPFSTLRNSVQDPLLGERLSESFIFPLQQRGYNLVDYRAVSLGTRVTPVSGGNLSLLRQRFQIYFALTGTYARYADGIVINARVLDTTTRQVLASAQTHIPDTRLEGALPGYDPIKARNNGYIIENGTEVRSE